MNVDVPEYCKYVTDFYEQCTKTCDYNINVSFHITLAVLFRNIIRVSCISYMAPDPRSHVRDVLIYPDAIVSNTI